MLAHQSAHGALFQHSFFPPKLLVGWDTPQQADMLNLTKLKFARVKSCTEFDPGPYFPPICPLFLWLSLLLLSPGLDEISSGHGRQPT